MSLSINKYYRVGLTALLALAAFVFWRFGYPHALAFQEQLQLFLLDGEYLLDRLAQPGGVARYAAEACVQFYNNVTAGAAILALLLVLLQLAVWRLMRAASLWYPLSFLPSALMWVLMGDENVMLTSLVALLIVVTAMLGCPKRMKAGIIYALVAIPLVYGMAGPVAVFLALYIPFRPSAGGGSWGRKALFAVAAVIYAVGLIIVSAHFLPYPLHRVALGLDYYRYVETLPHLYVVVGVVCLLLAVSGCRLPAPKDRRGLLLATGQVVFVVALLGVALHMAFDQRKYDLIDYDYLVRTSQWDAIVYKSVRQQPDLPMSVCATNLALAMRGELGDRLFEFYQHGTDGLLPPFERNFATLQLTGEAYFHLGLVNTAQRFAFEAMEAIPNYNKSARAVKRLAETNLVNGQYRVAAKYLRLLEKTIFYRKWAQRTATLLGQEEAIAQHPLYGKLRARCLTSDFLFSESEIDKICGQLFVHDPSNQLAMQYLLACPLLDGDIDRFMRYDELVRSKVPYNPRICQEAIAYAYTAAGQPVPGELVSPATVTRMHDFMRICRQAGKDSPALAPFRHTAWYYLIGGK